MTYDSTKDTLLHIKKVRELLYEFAGDLMVRGTIHDKSKLEEPEKSELDRVTNKLKDYKYGTPEYQANLVDIRTTLDHHYAHNDHHPEHHSNGIDGMNLLQIVEMLCDWQAASQRTQDGNILKSIEINKERFNISDQLHNIFLNTVKAP